MTNNDLDYLNGYLRVVETLNTFCNDGKTYTANFIDKETDINSSLQNFYQVTASCFKSNSMGSYWDITLIEDLKPYFCQMISQKEMSLTSEFRYNIENMLREFVLKIREFVCGAELFRIDVIWDIEEDGYFESYSNDYIFDLPDKYLYLHLGSSD